MSKLADARGLNIMFGMERTHLAMLSDSDLRYVKAYCKVKINGKQGFRQTAEFCRCAHVEICLLRHST